MAATTHSDKYQIKFIGTGKESSTWGESTNENFLRFEAAISDARSIDVLSMPLGSTSSSVDGTTPATWLTLNASDTGENGAEGRARAVEFTGAVTGNVTVQVRGNTSSVIPERLFFVKNSLDSTYTLTIDANTANDVTIKNGHWALVVIKTSTDGVFSAGVTEVFASPQFDGLFIQDSGTLEFGTNGIIQFDGASAISVAASNSNAFRVTSGATVHIRLDTSATPEKLVFGALGNQVNIDLSGGGNEDSLIEIDDNSATAMEIQDNSANVMLGADTTTGDPSIYVGDTSTAVDLQVNGDLEFPGTAERDIIFPNALAAALEIGEVGDPYLRFDSTTTSGYENVESVRILHAPHLCIDPGSTTGASYITFDGEDVAGSGLGFRSNSGIMQAKHTGSDWIKLVAATLGFEQDGTTVTQAISAASATIGEDKQGCIDIGPIRIIFNTVTATATPKTVTLGDAGDGTGANMSSALWCVFASDATVGSGRQQNAKAMVLSSAGRTLQVEHDSTAGTNYVTYFAIGDSGVAS